MSLTRRQTAVIIQTKKNTQDCDCFTVSRVTSLRSPSVNNLHSLFPSTWQLVHRCLTIRSVYLRSSFKLLSAQAQIMGLLN